ncbi:MAG: hypothetical protein Q9217_003984 [Psora testacea]
MYTAVAEGDTEILKELCCEGLYKKLNGRIISRPHDEKMRWTLHRYVGFPRVVSHRVVILPTNNSALRQVVVKIKSKQALTRLRRNEAGEEETVAGSGEVKQLLEYLVLQRRIFKAVEGPWKIWGTVEETKPEEVLGELVPKQSIEAINAAN